MPKPTPQKTARKYLADIPLPKDFDTPFVIPEEDAQIIDAYTPNCDSLRLKKQLYNLHLQRLTIKAAPLAIAKITDLLQSQKPEVARRAAMTILQMSHLHSAPDLLPLDDEDFTDLDLEDDPEQDPPTSTATVKERKSHPPTEGQSRQQKNSSSDPIKNRKLKIEPPPLQTFTLTTPPPKPPFNPSQLLHSLTTLLLLTLLFLHPATATDSPITNYHLPITTSPALPSPPSAPTIAAAVNQGVPPMPLSPLAGLPATPDMLINEDALIRAYYANKPLLDDPAELVNFGTSGHRGTSTNHTFTESHIRAITQAIIDYRKLNNITGPLFMGKDTHALSAPAQATALSVLAANNIQTCIAAEKVKNYYGAKFTPTPVISHAILTHNKKNPTNLADGIVITPSHNPPADGGFKYNPTNGGPADTDITSWIQNQANTYLRAGNKEIKSIPYDKALKAPSTNHHDYITPYVTDLPNVVNIAAIKNANLHFAVDPLGGASIAYWQAIADIHGLNLNIVNKTVDPTFSFMTVDHDGKIRMDPSSPYAMASLLKLQNQFPLAVANDPDADRHGIVTPTGLMNPNHYLAVAINYLLQNRPQWPTTSAIGKTVVSSSMINRVVASLHRTLLETPVGFKWFAPGLFDGSICFGGEESASASFLRLDGSPWSTDKDGILLALLAAEITAVTGKDPGQHYQDLTAKFGNPSYTRIDAPATPAQKTAFKKLTPDRISATTLAGDPITAKLTNAPGNNAPIGGLKIETQNGWFAARPSGTENIYKIYAESFTSPSHLQQILTEAQSIVTAALT